MALHRVALLGLAVAFVGACSSAGEEDVDESGSEVGSARALLEIHPLDIWGQPSPSTR
jgi:hypothetical protein